MGDQWDRDPRYNSDQSNQENIDKQLEELRRKLAQGATEAQSRLKRVVNKANDYISQAQVTPTPHQASNVEEQRLRQLINVWSNENWRVARELGSYMDISNWKTDEVWEISLQTRWETRAMEVVSEPYSGNTAARPRPVLPVWDYELPEVSGLKVPQSHTRLEGMNEVVACTTCNTTGHVLCSGCNGRGWIVCPDCKGRTKKRCDTCHGRSYVADWTKTKGEKKPFMKRQADNVASSLGNRVSDVFENIRQQGVPIPNPVDTDPAAKGPTIPCPDCINGEVDCTCGNGKRICPVCQGAKMSLCSVCAGTGKVVRHREIARTFDLRSQNRIIGNSPIPTQQLTKAEGDLIYSAEIDEALYEAATPDLVPQDVWQATVDLVQSERKGNDKSGLDLQRPSRPTLQVVELVRIPFTTVNYRYADQDYVLYLFDSEGREKFYADRFPARWDRIERLVKAISVDLLTPAQQQEQARAENQAQNSYSGGYRVPVEVPPYTVTEEEKKGNVPPEHS